LRRLLAQLATFGRSAFLGLRASSGPATVATATIAVTLLLVGAFALLVSNMERLLLRFGEEIRVSAYLEDGLTPEATRALIEQVRAAPGVESVSLVSKEEALRRFREGAFGRPSLLDGLDENPLPASLEIGLVPERRTAEGLAVLAGAIRDLPGIAELGYGREWVEGYARAVGLIRGIAAGLGVVLALATLLIVSNTIRLALYARRDEIAILRLVGASRLFVAVPFLIEGLLQGLAGGLLALGLLFAFFRMLLPALVGGLELLLGYVTPAFLSMEGALLLVAAGALLGVLGSAAALLQGTEG
jgi:cell division transport system permease protein